MATRGICGKCDIVWTWKREKRLAAVTCSQCHGPLARTCTGPHLHKDKTHANLDTGDILRTPTHTRFGDRLLDSGAPGDHVPGRGGNPGATGSPARPITPAAPIGASGGLRRETPGQCGIPRCAYNLVAPEDDSQECIGCEWTKKALGQDPGPAAPVPGSAAPAPPEILCKTCANNTASLCPLAGMTNSVEQPVQGQVIECIHYLQDWTYYGQADNTVRRGLVRVSPKASLALWKYSPGGFAWGYQGSGPAQLALALLLDATGDKHLAVKYHQDFKRATVANWLQTFEITRRAILEWVSMAKAVDAAPPAPEVT